MWSSTVPSPTDQEDREAYHGSSCLSPLTPPSKAIPSSPERVVPLMRHRWSSQSPFSPLDPIQGFANTNTTGGNRKEKCGTQVRLRLHLEKEKANQRANAAQRKKPVPQQKTPGAAAAQLELLRHTFQRTTRVLYADGHVDTFTAGSADGGISLGLSPASHGKDHAPGASTDAANDWTQPTDTVPSARRHLPKQTGPPPGGTSMPVLSSYAAVAQVYNAPSALPLSDVPNWKHEGEGPAFGAAAAEASSSLSSLPSVPIPKAEDADVGVPQNGEQAPLVLPPVRNFNDISGAAYAANTIDASSCAPVTLLTETAQPHVNAAVNVAQEETEEERKSAPQQANEGKGEDCLLRPPAATVAFLTSLPCEAKEPRRPAAFPRSSPKDGVGVHDHASPAPSKAALATLQQQVRAELVAEHYARAQTYASRCERDISAAQSAMAVGFPFYPISALYNPPAYAATGAALDVPASGTASSLAHVREVLLPRAQITTPMGWSIPELVRERLLPREAPALQHRLRELLALRGVVDTADTTACRFCVSFFWFVLLRCRKVSREASLIAGYRRLANVFADAFPLAAKEALPTLDVLEQLLVELQTGERYLRALTAEHNSTANTTAADHVENDQQRAEEQRQQRQKRQAALRDLLQYGDVFPLLSQSWLHLLRATTGGGTAATTSSPPAAATSAAAISASTLSTSRADGVGFLPVLSHHRSVPVSVMEPARIQATAGSEWMHLPTPKSVAMLRVVYADMWLQHSEYVQLCLYEEELYKHLALLFRHVCVQVSNAPVTSSTAKQETEGPVVGPRDSLAQPPQTESRSRSPVEPALLSSLNSLPSGATDESIAATVAETNKDLIVSKPALARTGTTKNSNGGNTEARDTHLETFLVLTAHITSYMCVFCFPNDVHAGLFNEEFRTDVVKWLFYCCHGVVPTHVRTRQWPAPTAKDRDTVRQLRSAAVERELASLGLYSTSRAPRALAGEQEHSKTATEDPGGMEGIVMDGLPLVGTTDRGDVQSFHPQQRAHGLASGGRSRPLSAHGREAGAQVHGTDLRHEPNTAAVRGKSRDLPSNHQHQNVEEEEAVALATDDVVANSEFFLAHQLDRYSRSAVQHVVDLEFQLGRLQRRHQLPQRVPPIRRQVMTPARGFSPHSSISSLPRTSSWASSVRGDEPPKRPKKKKTSTPTVRNKKQENEGLAEANTSDPVRLTSFRAAKASSITSRLSDKEIGIASAAAPGGMESAKLRRSHFSLTMSNVEEALQPVPLSRTASLLYTGSRSASRANVRVTSDADTIGGGVTAAVSPAALANAGASSRTAASHVSLPPSAAATAATEAALASIVTMERRAARQKKVPTPSTSPPPRQRTPSPAGGRRGLAVGGPVRSESRMAYRTIALVSSSTDLVQLAQELSRGASSAAATHSPKSDRTASNAKADVRQSVGHGRSADDAETNTARASVAHMAAASDNAESSAGESAASSFLSAYPLCTCNPIITEYWLTTLLRVSLWYTPATAAPLRTNHLFLWVSAESAATAAKEVDMEVTEGKTNSTAVIPGADLIQIRRAPWHGLYGKVIAIPPISGAAQRATRLVELLSDSLATQQKTLRMILTNPVQWTQQQQRRQTRQSFVSIPSNRSLPSQYRTTAKKKSFASAASVQSVDRGAESTAFAFGISRPARRRVPGRFAISAATAGTRAVAMPTSLHHLHLGTAMLPVIPPATRSLEELHWSSPSQTSHQHNGMGNTYQGSTSPFFLFYATTCLSRDGEDGELNPAQEVVAAVKARQKTELQLLAQIGVDHASPPSPRPPQLQMLTSPAEEMQGTSEERPTQPARITGEPVMTLPVLLIHSPVNTTKCVDGSKPQNGWRNETNADQRTPGRRNQHEQQESPQTESPEGPQQSLSSAVQAVRQTAQTFEITVIAREEAKMRPRCMKPLQTEAMHIRSQLLLDMEMIERRDGAGRHHYESRHLQLTSVMAYTKSETMMRRYRRAGRLAVDRLVQTSLNESAAAKAAYQKMRAPAEQADFSGRSAADQGSSREP